MSGTKHKTLPRTDKYVVDFSEADAEWINEQADKRQATYYKDGKNVFRDDRSLTSTYEQTLIAMYAEAAVSKYVYGTVQEMNTQVWEEEGDGGEDLKLPDGRVLDTKSTKWGYDRNKTPHLLVEEQNHWLFSDTTDLYVLTVSYVEENRVILHGWIQHGDVSKIGDFHREGDKITKEGTDMTMRNNNYVLSPADLKPITTL